MNPVFVASAVWHLLVAAAWVALPAWWPAWLAALAANHLLLTIAGLLPRCALLGPSLRRLPAAARARGEVAITLDDGPDPEVTPRVLAQLREAGARATFFCIGQRLRRHPDLARAIVAAGHQIANHTEHHSHRFAFLGPGGFRREIAAAQQTIEALAGRRPRFFRAPAGLRNPLLQPVLAALGLHLTAWTRRGYDTVRGDPDRVFGVLTRKLAAGDILLLHDGHAARTAAGEPVVLAVLPRLLTRLRECGLTPVTLDEAMPAAQPLRRPVPPAVAPDGRPVGTP